MKFKQEKIKDNYFAQLKENADTKYYPLGNNSLMTIKRSGKFKTVCLVFGFEISIPTNQLNFIKKK
jgi:hypothetical protein